MDDEIETRTGWAPGDRYYDGEAQEMVNIPPRIHAMKMGFPLDALDHPEIVAHYIDGTKVALENYAADQGAEIAKPYLAWIVVEAYEKDD